MRKFIIYALILLTLFVLPLHSGGSYEKTLTNQLAISTSDVQSTTSAVASTVPSDIISRDMSKLTRLYRFVDDNFYKDVDHEKAYEAMATALFESLEDQYSYYIPSSKTDNYLEESFGTYGGIGLYFSKNYVQYQDEDDLKTLYCVVDRVFPNTPCSRAGLRSDDFIIAIDGTDVIPLEADECAKMMKGEANTRVVLTVKRGDMEFELNLKREIVNVPTVDFTYLDNGSIGYVQITQFTDSTWQKTAEALIDFDDKNISKIIIDLRSNGGGDIDTALSIADCFINNAELLTIRYRNKEAETYKARSQMLVDSKVKVAILTNGQTASSSEILTGAMKDNNRATIIGTKTYGKGIMQIVSPFDEGFISLTEASFVTASHNEIHGVGIEPDIKVEELEMTEDEALAYTNIYNDRIIPKYVDNNPKFTDENIEAFELDSQYGEIRHEILRILVRYEYINRLPGDQQFVIDPNYDSCLKTAVDFLNGVE
ncbi:MAG: S41 family peptidase [Sphaerochaetaceae bacterium]|nr:S41 family peptidase [Sphaerochaetaceae bacterium]